jgi:hypothetical protein
MVNNEKDRLKALLKYWIAHNHDHLNEFKEWSEKAGVMGEAEVAADIKQAVVQMDKATALFTHSLKKLNGEEK